MKKFCLQITLLMMSGLFFVPRTYTQNSCINQNETSHGWTNVPLFDGENDYITIRAENEGEDNNASQWVEGDFTIDTWVKCTFSDDADETYTLFSAGEFGDTDNSVYIMFHKNKYTNNWQIRITDGFYYPFNSQPAQDLGQPDLIYNIDYANNFKDQWKHIGVTYDGDNMRLYIDGEHLATESGHHLGSIPWWHISIGDQRDGNHEYDFRGYVSGFRIWDNKKFIASDMAYIYDKTIQGRSSLKPDKQHLYDYLKVNMYSSPTNIYSLVSGSGMAEHGLEITNQYHPARPPRSHTFTATQNCHSIELNWTNASPHTTNYLYRKFSGDSGKGMLICRTNDNYYIDEEVSDDYYQEYGYYLETVWYNPNDPWNAGGYYTADEYENQADLQITAKIKSYPPVQNLNVLDDVSLGNCNGQVSLRWDPLPEPPSDYYISYKVGDGSFSTLVNGLTSSEYIHNVPDNELGKSITYYVDAGGDGCVNSSNQVVAQANRPCSTAPENLITIIGESITLDWSFTPSGAPATAFRIYRSTSGGAFQLIADEVPIDTRSYDDQTAIMCTDYQYKVEAYNPCGEAATASTATVLIPVSFNNVFTYTNQGGSEQSYFDASKGYFNQKVELEWEINPDKKADVEEIEIYRREPEQTYSLLATISNASTTTYNDQQTEANQMYEYLIRATGHCAANQVISDTLETLGFRNATGIISGKISFEGGNAVENAEVLVNTDNPAPSSSLYFQYEKALVIGPYPECNNLEDEQLMYHSLSFEAWVKPELSVSGQQRIIFMQDHLRLVLALVDMRPQVVLYDKNESQASSQNPRIPMAIAMADTLLQANAWYHFAFSLDAENGKLSLFLNGNEVASATYPAVVPWGTYAGNLSDRIYLGGITANDIYFTGNIDEVRLWQKARQPYEVARDYRRILAGDEEKMIGYWRFDENYGTHAYDISKTNGEFNKNHLVGPVTETQDLSPVWSASAPAFEQLHPSGLSDERGNFVVKGIRYTGNGGVFNVSPMLGVHEFDPTDMNLYLSDNEPVHNNIDFTDISSFRFTGSIKYRNTNFPVEGADVFVDNSQVFDAGGRPVKTDANGEFDIQVPIGQHYISVKKRNHTFENSGQWPPPTENNPYPTFNFQDDVYNIAFTDSTQVKLCGRFVGGNVEGNKPIGFRKSKANIGQGTIVMRNEKGYDIDLTTNFSSEITITTNNETGEYELWLLPENYTLVSVDNDNYEINPDNLGTLALNNIPEETVLTDTVFTENEDSSTTAEVLEYAYHFKRNFIYYADPQIVVFGENGEPFSGEKELIVEVENTDPVETDTLDLVNNSPFQFPVFKMGKSYSIDIRVFEIYQNYATSETDTVPVKNAGVNISNNIEIKEPVHTFETDEHGKVADYEYFRVGLPNMSKDESNALSFTKNLTITATTRGVSTTWEGNDNGIFRGYTLGGVDAGGSNFISYGPDLPQFILRDPPGSRSYSYLEQESIYSVSRDYSFKTMTNSVYDNKLMLGVKFEVGGGLAGPVVTSETQTDVNAGIESTSYVDRQGRFRETYRFLDRYSTSDANNAVGSMADVYIGKTMNMYFTETNNLRVYDKEYCQNSGLEYLGNTEMADSTAQYTIGQKPGFAATDDESSTLFIYTQDHILNSLLPEYRDLIYDLLASSKYESKVSAEHLFYGFPNNSPVWEDSATYIADPEHPSYEFLGDENEMDSVDFLNQQIAIWLQTIALNEAAKVTTDMEEVENISFDANAGAYTNEVTTSTNRVESRDYFSRFAFFGGSESGFNINGFGLVTYSQKYMSFDLGLTETDEETEQLKWGYVLDDDNQGDYCSVDVMRNEVGKFDGDRDEFLNSNNYDDAYQNLDHIGLGMGLGGIGVLGGALALSKMVNPLAGQVLSMSYTIATSAGYMGVMGTYKRDIDADSVYFGLQGASPIFRIRGGESRCPYEGPEYTFMYLDSTNNEPYLLHVGTQNHEQPKINIDPGIVVSVPENQEAVFTLQLTNESPTGKGVTYQLWVDEEANPDGAVMRIDGLNPNRPFFIPAGETLNKTLTVERGASGVLEYNNLQLILHSKCQFNPDDNYPDIADTVTFSVHFVPACTEVYFDNLNDNWVVNQQNNDTLTLEITGYDINQNSFEKIWLQYGQPGSNPVTKTIFYNNAEDFEAAPDPKLFINGEPELIYDFDMSAFNDGNYNLIVKSGCYDGSSYTNGAIPGTIDRITPKPFGRPKPADGVLSSNDEIELNFNEDINAGDLYAHKDYISVRGVVNGTDLKDNERLLHDASLHFDGQDDNMAVQHGINLDHTSFTMEFWAKRDRNGRECLVSLGLQQRGGLWIGFDQDNHFKFSLGGKTVVSEHAYTTDAWNHYSCVFVKGDNENASTISLMVLADAQNDEPDPMATQVFTSLEEVLYVGYCPEDGSAFQGNMHEFRIWNTARSSAEISTAKSEILNGYEQGLYGLWPMDDASGNFARDKTMGRNGVANATWHVSSNGKALAFDGASYAKAPAGSMIFDNQSSFTIEFWFKAQPSGSDMCILSNGTGDGSLSIDSWTIKAKANNTIEVSNNGETITFEAAGYLNNHWQHFAMSVDRQGYLSLFINAKLIKTTPASRFGGFGSSHLVLGAQWHSLAQIDGAVDYYTGEIDEVRVWKSSRRQKLIERYMNHALQGSEMGLKAYYPFEDVQIEDPSVPNETLDNITMDSLGIAGTFELVGDAAFTSECPNIKLHKPEVNLPFDYVINRDELIITPSMDAADIENTVLNISVERVKDMNNNRMSSVVSWTAFVDKNQVVWNKQELNIEKPVEEELIIKANIQNNSGLAENYEIKNVPNWMEVTPGSGLLNPLENQEIQITIKPSLNIGNYSRHLHLISSMGYNERLLINIAVKGQEPDWQVKPDDFEYSANIIGQLKINDALSTNTGDKIAAFINGQCRGVANVQYFETGNIYLFFMDVYDNLISGNKVSFKVYDAGSGQVFTDVAPILTFEKNKLYGSVSNPLPVVAKESIEQQFDLHKGWNWLSFNVFSPAFNDINMALAGFNAQPADAIKSQGAIAQLNSKRTWEGTLSALDYKEMYKFKVDKVQQFAVNGARVVSDTVNIELQSGWNWIGFPSTKQITVREALSSLHPSDGDILKSQQQFAVFDATLGWMGSLNYLVPGSGYMLSVQNPDTLVIAGNTTKSAFTESNSYPHIPASASNITLVSRLNLDNAQNYTLKAYVDNELCGIARPQQIDAQKPLFFITVNSQNGKTIRFEANNGGQALVADEKVEFLQDAHYGKTSKPHIFNFTSSLVDDFAETDQISVSPNPTQGSLWVKLSLMQKRNVEFEIFNALGVKLFVIDNTNYSKGIHKIDLSSKFQPLNNAVYILKVKLDNSEKYYRIIRGGR